MSMIQREAVESACSEAESNRRSHPRLNVLKRVLLYPVDQQVTFPIRDISHTGMAGIAALPLVLRQCVHVGFNDQRYLKAVVRWIDGMRVGLELKDPLIFIPGSEPAPENLDGYLPRSVRIPVEMVASLVVSRPHWPGTVRNISAGGMRIDTPIRLPEGEPLLVQLTDRPAILGRVQWSRDKSIGVRFGQAVDLDMLMMKLKSDKMELTDD